MTNIFTIEEKMHKTAFQKLLFHNVAFPLQNFYMTMSTTPDGGFAHPSLATKTLNHKHMVNLTGRYGRERTYERFGQGVVFIIVMSHYIITTRGRLYITLQIITPQTKRGL